MRLSSGHGFIVVALMGLGCDIPRKFDPARSQASEKIRAEKSVLEKDVSMEPAAAEAAPLVDRGIFSDLDDAVSTSCPPWLSNGPHVTIRDQETNQWWLSVQGIIVCGAEPANDGRRFARRKPGNSQDRDDDGIPDAVDILRGAKKAVKNSAAYKEGYFPLDYPGGDVPRDQGVCTDVIVRSLRNAGLDLQQAVHEDIQARPGAYPMVKEPDRHIDHRRVRTLLPYFEAHATTLPASIDDSAHPHLPGDVLFMDTMGDPLPEHMGIVSDRIGRSGHPLIVNNWNTGTHTKEMDLLGRVRVTHRFRVAGPAEVERDDAGPGGVLARQRLELPMGTRQLVLATMPLWTSSGGTLSRWERGSHGEFRQIGSPVAIRIGKAGLGRGLGLHHDAFSAPGPKREGDKKAPAGMFSLGTAFGRSAHAPRKTIWPYRSTTARDYFIDEISSPQYNSWVRLESGQKMEVSAEHLPIYRWGIVVEHNMPQPRPGAGSAIFLHVWASPESPTVGCTAMKESHLLELMTWLDPSKHPIFVQVADHVLESTSSQ